MMNVNPVILPCSLPVTYEPESRAPRLINYVIANFNICILDRLRKLNLKSSIPGKPIWFFSCSNIITVKSNMLRIPKP
jgi:hypothetical protein